MDIIDKKRLHHAYLLLGVGSIEERQKLALKIAKYLICEQLQNNEPCNICPGCRKIDGFNHPDVFWLDYNRLFRERKKESTKIKIESARIMQEHIRLKSYEADKKIYIIIDACELTDAAANSLLKTLEEPPEATVFILFASTVDNLLATVVSRCCIIRYKEQEKDIVKADFTSNIFNGLLLTIKNDKQFFDSDKYDFSGKDELCNILNMIIGVFRDSLIVKNGLDGEQQKTVLINNDCVNEIRFIAEQYDIEGITNIVNNLITTRDDIKSNVNPKLALQTMLLNIKR